MRTRHVARRVASALRDGLDVVELGCKRMGRSPQAGRRLVSAEVTPPGVALEDLDRIDRLAWQRAHASTTLRLADPTLMSSATHARAEALGLVAIRSLEWRPAFTAGTHAARQTVALVVRVTGRLSSASVWTVAPRARGRQVRLATRAGLGCRWALHVKPCVVGPLGSRLPCTRPRAERRGRALVSGKPTRALERGLAGRARHARPPFRLLHSRWALCRLWRALGPPWARGTMWSTVSSSCPGPPQIPQFSSSRSTRGRLRSYSASRPRSCRERPLWSHDRLACCGHGWISPQWQARLADIGISETPSTSTAEAE